MAKAMVLGPVRKDTQVEVSLTDARSLGVTAPIRESGDIAGSGACKLIGPAGEVELKEGVIAAKRHVHMTPEDAQAAGVEDKQIVSLAIESPNGRSLTFGDVVVRVSASYAKRMLRRNDRKIKDLVSDQRCGNKRIAPMWAVLFL